MGTIIEEIFSQRLGKKIRHGDVIETHVDYCMSHDTTTPLAISAWKKTGLPLYNRNKIIIVFDHYFPAPCIKSANTHKKILNFVKENKIRNFFTEGVSHQVIVEKGFAKPGNIIIGGDSHTCTYGALGCFSTGMGSTDIGAAWATGKTWLKIPETINIWIRGRFNKGVYAKDLILHIIKRLGANGATYKIIEFSGPAVESMEIHERLTLCNMAIEAGAKAGLIKTDNKTRQYFKSLGIDSIREIKPVNPKYEKTIEIDISGLEPQIAYPNRVDNVDSITRFIGKKLDQVFIGTCTNGRFEDLKIAAGILKNKKVRCRTIVVPASKKIYEKCLEAGIIETFSRAGAIIGSPGCGPCVGRHYGILADNDIALTTMNRNFTGRMGSPLSKIYLASPAVCAASALAGEITDPRRI